MLQEFDAPGNIGQFFLEVIVTAANQQKYLWDANEYELVVLVMNPGVLITQQGSSTTDNGFAVYNGWQRHAYSGTGATADSLGFKQNPTTGTILVLDMGRTIQLPQEFEAPGNIGQFSLQVIVSAANQHKYAWARMNMS